LKLEIRLEYSFLSLVVFCRLPFEAVNFFKMYYRQPLDSYHQLLIVTIVVTFVGKWVTASVIQLIHKKAAGALCRQLG
jgi:hypothetical protein